MKRSQALAAVVGAVVVYGLAAFQFKLAPFFQPATPPSVATTCDRHQALYCRGNHCDIEITVDACSAAGIKVPENDLHLCKRDGVKTINWKLPPGGPYKFRDNGIEFKNLPNTDDFDPASRSKGPFKYSWDDKLRNGGGRTFDYWIRIENASGQPCDKDPRISND